MLAGVLQPSVSYNLPCHRNLAAVGTFKGARFNIDSVLTSVSGTAEWGQDSHTLFGDFSKPWLVPVQKNHLGANRGSRIASYGACCTLYRNAQVRFIQEDMLSTQSVKIPGFGQ